jgi:hypothetical protein
MVYQSAYAPQLVLCLLVAANGLVGCSKGPTRPKVVPVSGSIKFKGAPLPNATVTFLPEGSSPRNPFGTTDASGNFKLTSYDTDDGAVPGDYVVVIVAGVAADGKKPEERTAQDMINMGPGGKIPNQTVVPEKYKERKTSGLKRSVVAGDANVFNIDLAE